MTLETPSWRNTKQGQWLHRMQQTGRCMRCGQPAAMSQRDGHVMRFCAECNARMLSQRAKRKTEDRQRHIALGMVPALAPARRRTRRTTMLTTDQSCHHTATPELLLRAHDYPQYVEQAKEYVDRRLGVWKRSRRR